MPANIRAPLPPTLPIGHGKVPNKAMHGFDALRCHMVHCNRVSRSKSTIDNSWSGREVGKLQPSQRNVKRHQQRNDRFDEIGRENRRLVQRFMEIDQKTPSWQPPSWAATRPNVPQMQRQQSLPPGAGLAEQEGGVGQSQPAPQRMSVAATPFGPTTAKRSASQPPTATATRRMNPARKKEMQRIAEENARLLKKIQGARPAALRVNNLEQEHAHQQQVMRLRCEHSLRTRPRNRRGPDGAPATISGKGVQDEGPVDEEYERLCKLERNLRKKLGEGPDGRNLPFDRERMQEALRNFEPLDRVFDEAKFYEQRVEDASAKVSADDLAVVDPELTGLDTPIMHASPGSSAPDLLPKSSAGSAEGETGADGTEEGELLTADEMLSPAVPSSFVEKAEEPGANGAEEQELLNAVERISPAAPSLG